MPTKLPASSFSAKLLLVLASTALCALVLEGGLRLIGFDFEAGQRQAYEAYPIFYRQPRKPLETVFFHREGPARWTGNVLVTGLRQDGGLDDAYADAPETTITYDGRGFRNPEDLADWELIVVGDSFVELGHLPYEDLFTTQLATLLGVRVKNVGASYSGPLTYVAYLRHFGAAPGARHALMVFFEGNDLTDGQREAAAQRTFETTGERPYRAFERQTSFLKAVYRLARRLARGAVPRPHLFRNAYFASWNGEQAVSVNYTPPRSDQVSAETRRALDQALAAWASTARAFGMQPWLVYMPCKRRVLDGHLRFTDSAPPPLAAWQPTDLPAFVKHHADQHGITFIDVTPALIRETRQGRLTYNTVWDTHLNRHGASVVARTLADTLRAYLE
jgi:hypothetical protein